MKAGSEFYPPQYQQLQNGWIVTDSCYILIKKKSSRHPFQAPLSDWETSGHQ